MMAIGKDLREQREKSSKSIQYNSSINSSIQYYYTYMKFLRDHLTV